MYVTFLIASYSEFITEYQLLIVNAFCWPSI